MSNTILVVEDDLAIQELIRVNLEFAGFEVTTASDTKAAQKIIGEALPKLLIVDWMLPDTSGVDFIRKLRDKKRTRQLPIIMLTAKSTESDKVTGLDSGADDYLTKPFSSKELIARIKALQRRLTPELTDSVINVNGLVLDPSSQRVTGNDISLSLGPTEFKLLHFFMTHPDRVYSRNHLLDQIWGDHVFIEERTIDVHVRRLRKALQPSGHERLLETVRGSGYRFTQPHE